jgi:4-oxalocrotonate tautomerase family enzyme
MHPTQDAGRCAHLLPSPIIAGDETTGNGATAMPVIQCDIREGWTDDQKRALAKGLTQVVAEVGKVPVKSIHIVIREGRGLHYMFGGEHVPEYQPAGGG